MGQKVANSGKGQVTEEDEESMQFVLRTYLWRYELGGWTGYDQVIQADLGE